LLKLQYTVYAIYTHCRTDRCSVEDQSRSFRREKSRCYVERSWHTSCHLCGEGSQMTWELNVMVKILKTQVCQLVVKLQKRQTSLNWTKNSVAIMLQRNRATLHIIQKCYAQKATKS